MGIIQRVRRMRTRNIVVSVGIVGVLVALAFIPVPQHYQMEILQDPLMKAYPELAELSSMKGGFSVYAPYFKALATAKGAVYAFEVLNRASLVPNTDLHLLGHVVGEELYAQKGVQGMAYCTNDFRNACSHTIVVGAFLERGEGAVPDIVAACQKAPGSKGAYTMCFHGLGHGVLAYVAYELPKAIALCEQFGTLEHHYREYKECVGGAIMELISGGSHDKDLWERVAPTYFKADDPLYPCTASFMPESVQPKCFNYLTPHVSDAVGTDRGNPTIENVKNAFRLCQAVPHSQKENRDNCFGGFGKEFVALAKARDIRKIEEMTHEELSLVREWCGLAPDAEGIQSCDGQALQSLYWGGENKPEAAVRFCSLLPDTGRQEHCVKELTSAVAEYVDDRTYRESLCRQYPDQYTSVCTESLLTDEH